MSVSMFVCPRVLTRVLDKGFGGHRFGTFFSSSTKFLRVRSTRAEACWSPNLRHVAIGCMFVPPSASFTPSPLPQAGREN